MAMERISTAPTDQAFINAKAQEYLDSTDWMAIRHRDQLAAGLPTSLTDTEYQDLLVKRQVARDSIKL